jgi:serine/threonine protein kinase
MNDGKEIHSSTYRSAASPTTRVAPKSGRRKKADSLIGSTIDSKYLLLERIGLGAMGAVYKAEHTMMGRIVALKLLHRHLTGAEDDEFFKRFQREARTACKIEHPNAVTLYDFGIHNEQAYIVMQYNPGRTLKTILAKEGPLSAQRTLQIMEQVCPAIAAAHKLGIVHRDLKPDNIMCRIDEEGIERVQVLDFGLAKVMGDPEGPINTMTKNGIVMGTPHYMAPEQALGKQLDARSDIYALGITLYEMLSGKVPFNSDSAVELMLKHISDKPTPLRKLLRKGEIPSELEAVVNRSLKKEPKNRQQTVSEFLDQIRSAVTHDTSFKKIIRKSKPKKKVKAVKEPRRKVTPTPHRKTQSGKSSKRRWSNWALASMVGLGITLATLSYPYVTYFSPEEIARRAEAIERQKRAQLHIDLAREFIKNGNLGSAAYELVKAQEKNPSDAKIYYQLGTIYAKQFKLDKAAIVLQNAVRVDPAFSQAHFALGNIYFKQHKITEAISQYKRTLQLDRKHRLALKNLKLCRKALRDYK